MRRLTDLLKRFRRDESGAFLVLFAVIALVLIATSGAVVDFTYLQTARSRAQNALDAAALALQAGVSRDNAVVVPDGQSGIKMLQDGRIDAYALPTLSIRDLVQKASDSNLEVITPVKDTPVFCAGAAFNKNDTDLRDAYDKVLAEMQESGEFKKIVEPFGFPAEAAKLTNREQLCGGPN